MYARTNLHLRGPRANGAADPWADLTERHLRVLYPSGQRLTFHCAWGGQLDSTLGIEACSVLLTRQTTGPTGQPVAAGTVLLLDPRAVVVDLATLKVLHQPRSPLFEVAAEAGEWLRENPSWPASALAWLDTARRRRR